MFALGASLYELASDKRLCKGKSAFQQEHEHSDRADCYNTCAAQGSNGSALAASMYKISSDKRFAKDTAVFLSKRKYKQRNCTVPDAGARCATAMVQDCCGHGACPTLARSCCAGNDGASYNFTRTGSQLILFRSPPAAEGKAFHDLREGKLFLPRHTSPFQVIGIEVPFDLLCKFDPFNLLSLSTCSKIHQTPSR